MLRECGLISGWKITRRTVHEQEPYFKESAMRAKYEAQITMASGRRFVTTELIEAENFEGRCFVYPTRQAVYLNEDGTDRNVNIKPKPPTKLRGLAGIAQMRREKQERKREEKLFGKTKVARM